MDLKYKRLIERRTSNVLDETPIMGFSKDKEKCAKQETLYIPLDSSDKQYCADNYSCWPPPVFIPLITVIEVSTVSVSPGISKVMDIVI